MDTRESSAPAHPTTRITRGLALYRDHAGEIEPLGKGVYRVPGCSGGTYTVDLDVFGGGEESCNCPDRAPLCKHIYAAAIFRTKARAKARREQAKRTAARASAANLAGLAARL